MQHNICNTSSSSGGRTQQQKQLGVLKTAGANLICKFCRIYHKKKKSKWMHWSYELVTKNSL